MDNMSAILIGFGNTGSNGNAKKNWLFYVKPQILS